MGGYNASNLFSRQTGIGCGLVVFYFWVLSSETLVGFRALSRSNNDWSLGRRGAMFVCILAQFSELVDAFERDGGVVWRV
jgi:hypothetical protein